MRSIYVTILIVISTLILLIPSNAKKCRALALSGGGDKGSYQASVFIEFTKLLPKEDVSYHVITGASAGSLNGAGLSLFAPGEEAEAAKFIYSLWNSISTNDILKMWDGGILAGLFTKSGIFNNQPLISFLQKQIGTKTIKNKFTVSLANADKGRPEFVDFEESSTLPDNFIPTIVGSSALPFAFPSMTINGTTYIDGGSIWNLNIGSAVRRCREMVDDDSDIIVDIILCTEYDLQKAGDLSKFTTLSHFDRMRKIEQWNDNMQDIIRSLRLYTDVEFRYVIGPSEILSNSLIPLDFSKEHLKFCFEIGKKDAHNAIKLGSGGYRDALIEFEENRKVGGSLTLNDIIEQKLNYKTYAIHNTSA